MEKNEVSRESIQYLLNMGKAKLAAKMLTQIGENAESIEGLPLWYFLSLAQAEHYSHNQEKVVEIYRYTIKFFPDCLLAIYYEMVTHAPEMEELFEIMRQSTEVLNDDSIYYILACPLRSVFTAKQLSLYQQRYLFACDILEKKNIPLTDSTRIQHTLAHYALFDKNKDDLPIRKRLANLCKQNVEGLVIQDFVKASPKERIKVGICVSRYDNIDFQTMIGSLFQSFDLSKFELVFFGALRHKKGANLRVLHRLFGKIIFYDDQDWRQLRTLLIQEKLDVLLSENIGFCATSLVFFSRVAPIQCNIFDRLTSLGAPFIDYYVCFGEKDVYKQWDAAKFDYEKYAVLGDTYLSPAPKRATATEWDLTEIGLPENAKFVFYPQVLSRLLPEDDYIVKTLLENNPQLYFVAFTSSAEFRLMFYRWEEIMPNCMDRIIFMEKQPLDKFLWVIKQASVVLGSFKGGHGVVTMATVFSQGQPMVAGHGDCFAAAQSKFYYAKMGIEDLLANSHEEAVQIAQRLLDDPTWKAEKSAEINANSHEIYNGKGASRQFQEFIIQAYDRAVKDLPIQNWEHGTFIE